MPGVRQRAVVKPCILWHVREVKIDMSPPKRVFGQNLRHKHSVVVPLPTGLFMEYRSLLDTLWHRVCPKNLIEQVFPLVSDEPCSFRLTAMTGR